MLLTSVGLKNFMKHESLTVQLEAGMNIIRGGNEAGKSSLLTGIAYNWFGASALPQSVEDTVTWDAKKSSMKTKTDFTVGIYDYVCYRSASGAELHRGKGGMIDGKPLVVGHKEVSAAIATLFDLPSVATATKLQIASQNDVRGVISLGATAAAAFIEELIDMRDIDDMIKDVSDKLTHSSDAKKQAVASADLAAEQLKEVAKPVSTKKLENEVASAEENVTSCKAEFDVAQLANMEAEHALKVCTSNISATQRLMDGLKQKIRVAGTKLEAPTKGITAEDVERESDLLDQNTRHNFYTNDFLPFLRAKPDSTWEGDLDSLNLYVSDLEEKYNGARERISDLKVEVAKAEGGIITDILCPTCGQEICDKAETEENNAVLQLRIAGYETEMATLVIDNTKHVVDLSEANNLLAFQQKQSLWVLKRPLVAEGDLEVVPYAIYMIDGYPEKPSRVVTPSQFNTLCSERDRQVEAEQAYAENLAAYQEMEKELVEFAAKVDGLGVEHQQLEDASATASAAHQEAKEGITEASGKHLTLIGDLALVNHNNEFSKKTRKSLTAAVASWKERAEEIQDNYNLISALRSARLDISSLLWQKLLGVTETYFSLFRGKPSELNMSKKGILVDGHLSAPSGSTLDILGLALRLAMSKLFANNGLCILDEPSAGCDDARTAAMTGGLLSAGFDQVIMVTHKDVDDQAGNLILI